MYGIKENKKRYGNLALPTSVNSSVIRLKKLSRRIKLEINRHPVPALRHELSKTWINVNKVLQRMRQLESDYIASTIYETNVGRKKYQSHLITTDKLNDNPVNRFVELGRKHFPWIDKGITIGIGDTWKVELTRKKYSYIVVAIGNTLNRDGTFSSTKNPMVTLRKKTHRTEHDDFPIADNYITINASDLLQYFYLHDVAFYDEDYTPYYCDQCDTWHECWANDGGYKLND